MPIFEGARNAIAAAQEQQRQVVAGERDQTVSAITGDLSVVLAEPEFTGDVEVALIHYMGERAITDEDATQPYVELAERIQQNAAEHPQLEAVPVLFIAQTFDELGEYSGPESAFMQVPRDSVNFKSKVIRTDEPVMGGRQVKDATSDEKRWVPDTVEVTDKEIALVAPTIAFAGNVLDIGALQGESAIEPKFVLHASQRAATSPYTGVYVDRFVGGEKVFVGWKEIEVAFMDRKTGLKEAALAEALKLKALFSASTSPDVLKEYAPRIAEIIEAAEHFQGVVGSTATSAE